jgi:large subunit ribosomal protein L18
MKKGGGNVKAATEVGTLMAKRLKDKGIENIIFDRGGFLYHGRIKAAAEAMRKAGIKF